MCPLPLARTDALAPEDAVLAARLEALGHLRDTVEILFGGLGCACEGCGCSHPLHPRGTHAYYPPDPLLRLLRRRLRLLRRRLLLSPPEPGAEGRGAVPPRMLQPLSNTSYADSHPRALHRKQLPQPDGRGLEIGRAACRERVEVAARAVAGK